MKLLGEDNPATGQSLHNLGHIYRLLDRLNDAEPILLRALKVREKYEGRDHLTVAHILYDLGSIYEQWSKYKQAEVQSCSALCLPCSDEAVIGQHR